MSVKEGRTRITVTFTDAEYEAIKNISSKQKISMSEVVRNFSVQGINGKLTQDNLDFIIPIIRNQLSSLLNPAVDRLSKLSAKTCVQAGAAAYLSAEALSKFVPHEYMSDYTESYEKARKRAVGYMKNNSDLE